MENYNKITDRIKELAADPSTLAAHVDNNVSGIREPLPNISQAIGNHIVNSVHYLNDKIPKPTAVLPLMEKWEPSDMQKQKFQRHYEAVNNPTDALHQIAKGTLSGDTMQALQAVHPDLLQDMQQKIKQEIKPTDAAALPHHIKRGLSMFLGSPLESIDLPAVKASNQAVFQNQQAQKNQQSQMTGKSTQKGLSELGVSKRAATETQRDESESD